MAKCGALHADQTAFPLHYDVTTLQLCLVLQVVSVPQYHLWLFA
jgi:hypothetical protein